MKSTWHCAQCHFQPGRYLVCLRRSSDLWVGANWQLSARPIKGDTVEWFLGGKTKLAPVRDVVAEIERILASQARQPTK